MCVCVDIYVLITFIYKYIYTHIQARSTNCRRKRMNAYNFAIKKIFLHIYCMHRVIFKLASFAIIAANCLKKIKIMKNKMPSQFSPKHIFNSLCTLLSLIISTNLALPQRFTCHLRSPSLPVPQTTRYFGL